MRFEPLRLSGTFLIHHERHQDNRGHFARTFCAREFAQVGLVTHWVQCNTSFNIHAGTLRGLHWQAAPHEEAKIVRVTRGSIYDVMVDIRPNSSTYCQWHSVKMNADEGADLYVPTGFAHGFITLSPNTEVFYQMSAFYDPASVRGARFDDPAFGIEWPSIPHEMPTEGDRRLEAVAQPGPILSQRDSQFPPFSVEKNN